MTKLSTDRRPGSVHRISESAQARQRRLTHHDLSGSTRSFSTDAAVCDRGHPHPTVSKCAMERNQVVGYQTVG